MKNLVESLETRRLLTALLPDLQFGNDGFVDVAAQSIFTSLSNGKILTLGGGRYTTLLANGSADPESTDVYVPSLVDTLVNPDGSVTALAEPGNAGEAVVIKYTAAGQADTAFGPEGTRSVVLPLTLAGVTYDSAEAISIAPAADGGFVIAGVALENSLPANLFVLKLNAAGALDTSFGDDGVRVSAANDSDFSRPIVRVDTAGRPLVYTTATATTDGRLTRLTPAGALDTTFGTGGSVAVPRGNGFFKLDGDKPVISTSAIAKSREVIYVSRYTAAGALDTTFGTGGTASVTSDRRGGTADLDVDANHRVVLGIENAVYRFTSAGVLDNTFGVGGKLDLSGIYPYPLQVNVVSDTKVLVSDSNGLLQLDARLAIELSNTGALVATGTTAADSINITRAGNVVTATFNGVSSSPFDQADVLRVSLLGSGGADDITVTDIDFLSGSVVVQGNAGNDTYHLTRSGSVILSDSAGNSTVTVAETALDFISSVTATDNITVTGGTEPVKIATGFNSTITTGDGADDVSFVGQATINAGAGDDKVYVRRTGDPDEPAATRGSVIDGGDGNDVIRLETNPFGDTISGGAGNDDIRTGAGNDTLSGNGGKDTIRAGAGDDVIAGNGGNDRLFGQDGRDVISGSAGNDAISGGGGSDKLYGGIGISLLYGDSGNDTLVASGGPSTLVGGGGNDIFVTRNSVIDLIDGLGGTDSGQIDSNDEGTSLETLLA